MDPLGIKPEYVFLRVLCDKYSVLQPFSTLDPQARFKSITAIRNACNAYTLHSHIGACRGLVRQDVARLVFVGSGGRVLAAEATVPGDSIIEAMVRYSYSLQRTLTWRTAFYAV